MKQRDKILEYAERRIKSKGDATADEVFRLMTKEEGMRRYTPSRQEIASCLKVRYRSKEDGIHRRYFK